MALVRWVGRAIGLDVHLDFSVVAICEDGKVRSAGRVPSTPEGLRLLAESVLAMDRVALEVTASCGRSREPRAVRGPGDRGEAGGHRDRERSGEDRQAPEQGSRLRHSSSSPGRRSRRRQARRRRWSWGRKRPADRRSPAAAAPPRWPPVGAGARPGNIAAASARSAANMGATRRDVNVIPHPRWLMPLAAARSGTESRFRWHRGQGRRGAAWPRELKFPELFGKRHHAPSLRPTTRALLSQTTALSQPGVRSPKSTTFTGRPASPTQRTGSPDRRTSAIESDGFAWPHRDGRKASQRRNG